MPIIKLPPIQVVINRCYGGFGLSRAAYDWLKAKGSPLIDGVSVEDIEHYGSWSPKYGPHKDYYRAHPDLVAVVQALGAKANGPGAKLVIEDVEQSISIDDDDDGMERIER